MAVEMSTVLGAALAELRVQPVVRRVRADLGDTTVVDTTAARLVWEPRRVVSAYAVPVTDIAGRLVTADSRDGADGRVEPDAAALPPVLTPREPFAVHSAGGTAYDNQTGGATLPGAAFVVDDPDLDGYALLDWTAFTRWYEEGQEAVGRPREPFHRIQCLPSTRHVVVEIGGQIVADTHRPTLLLETPTWSSTTTGSADPSPSGAGSGRSPLIQRPSPASSGVRTGLAARPSGHGRCPPARDRASRRRRPHSR